MSGTRTEKIATQEGQGKSECWETVYGGTETKPIIAILSWTFQTFLRVQWTMLGN
jgi:hypothetical protein